jgi:hypothetical protein
MAFLCGAIVQAQVSVKQAVEVSFETEKGSEYQLFGAVEAGGDWARIGGAVSGDGERAIFFFRAVPGESGFFKVEEKGANENSKDSIFDAAIHRSWSGKDFSMKDLSGIEIKQTEVRKADPGPWEWPSERVVEGSTFDGSDLSNVTLHLERVETSSFVGAKMLNMILLAGVEEFTFLGCNFTGAELTFQLLGRSASWNDPAILGKVAFVDCVMPDGENSNR